MKEIYGYTIGLKGSYIKRLENFYKQKIPPSMLISYELLLEMCSLSFIMGRQIGLIINRKGKIESVAVGDRRTIAIPNKDKNRTSPDRLWGLRFIHTRFGMEEKFSEEDTVYLSLLRLDFVAAVNIGESGQPDAVYAAHINPSSKDSMYDVLTIKVPEDLDIDCLARIKALEKELKRKLNLHNTKASEKAILISITNRSKTPAINSIEELRSLAETAGIKTVGLELRIKRKTDSRFLIGTGDLSDIAMYALKESANILIFDQELNPSQTYSITNRVDLKVIDRTQLILDIFAQRAKTKEGKLQVELAQLRYRLPRLDEKDTAMSRLTGGIGGRGPGETKLEINRRRVRERIAKLEKELKSVIKQRKQQRARREKNNIPVVSIIGYTNAGKSTLLNTLTKSDVYTQNKLFATLDPSSRRLKVPENHEVIITDTVGFIKNIPKNLMTAFRATFEQLETADIFLQVIDISDSNFTEHIKSVESIIQDLKLSNIPVIRALNKADKISGDKISEISEKLQGVPISAFDKFTLTPLMDKIKEKIIF